MSWMSARLAARSRRVAARLSNTCGGGWSERRVGALVVLAVATGERNRRQNYKNIHHNIKGIKKNGRKGAAYIN
jgi:aromatic ring hydroxylase